ncbi:hypothetical protein C8R42DRAFT_658306 [Lentinula raphanica]|nr:hypothetical protein C8R42DRAFT_658306 [Lentinula raphanica]
MYIQTWLAAAILGDLEALLLVKPEPSCVTRSKRKNSFCQAAHKGLVFSAVPCFPFGNWSSTGLCQRDDSHLLQCGDLSDI